ncbi:MAG: hypothetical protein ACFFE8_17465 [Candidatus Heimdallarchaeota archaeon]
MSSVYVNGTRLFTSQNANQSFVMEDIAQEVNQQEVWINRFKSNYTVIGQNDTTSYPTVTVSAPLDSIDLDMRSSGHLSAIPLSDYLASLFPPLFTELKSIALDESFTLEKSLVRYRICYPEWGGGKITHDPWLIAQFSPKEQLLLGPLSDILQIAIIGIFILGLISLTIAIVRWKDLIGEQRF